MTSRLDQSASAQLPPVGRPATIEELAIGALLYSSAEQVVEIALDLELGDFAEPAQSVLDATQSLAQLGIPPGPELVADELRRRGKWNRRIASWLTAATVSGASPPAARHYCAAVVAESLRRQADSVGIALTRAAKSGPENEVCLIAEEVSARMRAISERLVRLRGLVGG